MMLSLFQSRNLDENTFTAITRDVYRENNEKICFATALLALVCVCRNITFFLYPSASIRAAEDIGDFAFSRK
jgi:hypothetical protein